ncbi:Mce-associated membrane protein [Actinomadura rupiterrae]|nr:Mce-associated membrane protein [Actinomadura rupiterrae]
MDTKEDVEEEATPAAEEEAKPKPKARTRDVTKRPVPEPETEAEEEPEPEEPEAKAEEKEEPPAEEPKAKRSLRRDPLILVALAVTAASAVAAAWFGWSYHSASNDKSISQARLRDQVLRTAEQEVVNLNTLDYNHIDQGLSLWQDSTTAELYDQIVQGRQQLATSVTKAKTVSTAKILESGITELDSDAGKAGVMIAVRVSVATPDGKSSASIRRLSGQLTRTSAGWKLSALGQAPTSSGN